MTRQYSLLGTPAYMSPEQAEGRIRDVDQRADVFALAAIVWEMLTGTMAFAAPTIADALHRVRLVDPPDVHVIRPEVPPAVSAALRRALAKDRLARTPSVPELAGELNAALRGSSPAHIAAAPDRSASRAGLALAATAAPTVPPVHRAPAVSPSPSPWPAVAPATPASGAPPPPQWMAAPPVPPWPAAVPATPASGAPPPPQWMAAPPVPPNLPGPFLPVAPSASGPFQPGPPSPSGPPTPMRVPAGSRPGPTVPASRGLVIAIVAGTLVVAGIWVAVARTLSPGSDSPTAATDTEPVAEPTETRPDERPAPAAVVPDPVPAGPVPETPAAQAVTVVPQVSLTFSVEPRVAAKIRVDGEPVAHGRISVERSGEPVAVTAEAKGYSSFRAQVVPDQDRTVRIVLHKARHRTGAAARVKPPVKPPTPAPKADATEPATPRSAAPAPEPEPRPLPQPAEPRPAPSPSAVSKPAPRPAPKQPKPRPKAKPGTGTIFDQ
jgi:hypothetical protein